MMNGRPQTPPSPSQLPPRTIVLLYAVAAFLCAVLTAVLVHSFPTPSAFLASVLCVGTFIASTAWLLYRSLEHRDRERRAALDRLDAAREGAREERAWTEAVLAAIGDAISVQDRDFRVIYQNPLHKELMGDHVGERCYQAYRRNDRVCDGCHLALSFEDGGIHKAERTLVTGAGTRYFEIISSPLKGSGGAVIACIEAVREITDRRRTEERVRENEKRYRTLFENAGDAIFVLEAEGGQAGRIVDANQAAASMHGYSLDELLTTNIRDLDSPDAAQEAAGRIRKILDGEWAHAEITHRRKDGTIFPVEISAGMLEIGNHRYILAIDRDITDRKTAESFRRNILEAVDEAFIVIGRDFRVLSANTAYARQAKLSEDEIIGRHCYEISHQRDTPCWESGEDCAVRRTFETGRPHTALHVHRNHDGNAIYVETKSFPMADPSGRVVSAIEIINDITAKKKLEEQLRHAQKMEAIGTLTGGIAHDFNNILTAILGYASVSLKKLTQDDPLRPAMDHIFLAAQRAASLTRSLLAFSRKQPMTSKPEDLNEIVRHLEKLLLRIIGEDVELKTDLAGRELMVMADRGQMELVLMNLCTNARDAMPAGGVLSLSTGSAELDAEGARIRGLGRPGPYAVLSVSDTGTGIDERILGKIFDPFFTTKEVGKGTGLGLSIIYGIVTQHGGAIDVQSEPGKGATFRIFLPVISERSEALRPADVPEVQGGSETVLVAEDSEDVRRLIRNTLADFGYDVIEAADGEDAVQKFLDNADRVQLLIFDVIMPKMNGKEAFDAIRKVRPDVKVIFTSGYTTDIIGKKGIRAEGLDFLPKPLLPNDLVKKVREVLR